MIYKISITVPSPQGACPLGERKKIVIILYDVHAYTSNGRIVVDMRNIYYMHQHFIWYMHEYYVLYIYDRYKMSLPRGLAPWAKAKLMYLFLIY